MGWASFVYRSWEELHQLIKVCNIVFIVIKLTSIAYLCDFIFEMALIFHQLQGVKDVEVRAPLVYPHLQCMFGAAQSSSLIWKVAS